MDAVATDAGELSSHDAYLRFEPKKCREYALRENSVVVFIVTALQLGLAFYLASWLIVLADLHSHPRVVLTFAWKQWPVVEQFVMSHWFSNLGQVAVFLRTALFAAVVVLTGRLISFARSRA